MYTDIHRIRSLEWIQKIKLTHTVKNKHTTPKLKNNYTNLSYTSKYIATLFDTRTTSQQNGRIHTSQSRQKTDD